MFRLTQAYGKENIFYDTAEISFPKGFGSAYEPLYEAKRGKETNREWIRTEFRRMTWPPIR
jgi:hypothetical protein